MALRYYENIIICLLFHCSKSKGFYDLYDSEKIKNAILYAKDLKDRYTVLWMNYDLFGGV